MTFVVKLSTVSFGSEVLYKKAAFRWGSCVVQLDESVQARWNSFLVPAR